MKIAQMMAVETNAKALLDSYTLNDFIRDCEPAMASEYIAKGKIVERQTRIRVPKEEPKADPNTISVKFDDEGNITSATSERLARIESYRKQVEFANEDDFELIPHNPNVERADGNRWAFAKAMMRFHNRFDD